ncbi:MAG: hypothetical protein U9R54_09610 [Bacteroidota bacterium]|nr:hypothetical protein [Bacteroidota bacterium]
MKIIKNTNRSLAVLFSALSLFILLTVSVYAQGPFEINNVSEEFLESVKTDNVNTGDDCLKSFELKETEIENWMLDDNFWTITEKFEWDNVDEGEMELEEWMYTFTLDYCENSENSPIEIL